MFYLNGIYALPYEQFATLSFAFRADAMTFQEINIHAADFTNGQKFLPFIINNHFGEIRTPAFGTVLYPLIHYPFEYPQQVTRHM